MPLIFSNLENVGLLALRLALGLIFIYHGWPKLKNAQAMSKGMGFSPAFVFLLGLFEVFVAGIALILGLLTEIVAIVVALEMLGTIYLKTTKWKVQFSSFKTTGWEFDLLILAAAIALAFLGAGAYSIDAMIGLI